MSKYWIDIQYIDGMLWEIERVCRVGVKVPRHVRRGLVSVGSVRLSIERDVHRARQTLVATASSDDVPPLFDVHVMPNDGSLWVLSGYECQPDSAGRPQFTAQTWLMRPGPEVALEKADLTISKLHQEIATLKGVTGDNYWSKRERKGTGR